MNCQNHPDVPATAYCRACGKPVCNECRIDALGTVFCAEHAAAPPPPPPPGTGYQPPVMAPPMGYVNADVSPALAFLLGWIPGVGAIYNGQYAKGLVHAIVFGLMISILESNTTHGLEPIFGILLGVWVFYMAFEAYHTARKRRMGEPVDEYSSLLGSGRQEHFPVAGVTLIVLGVVLLLHTLELLSLDWLARFWPVLLIAAGAYMLYSRYTAGSAPSEPKGWGNER